MVDSVSGSPPTRNTEQKTINLDLLIGLEILATFPPPERKEKLAVADCHIGTFFSSRVGVGRGHTDIEESHGTRQTDDDGRRWPIKIPR